MCLRDFSLQQRCTWHTFLSSIANSVCSDSKASAWPTSTNVEWNVACDISADVSTLEVPWLEGKTKEWTAKFTSARTRVLQSAECTSLTTTSVSLITTKWLQCNGPRWRPFLHAIVTWTKHLNIVSAKFAKQARGIDHIQNRQAYTLGCSHLCS